MPYKPIDQQEIPDDNPSPGWEYYEQQQADRLRGMEAAALKKGIRIIFRPACNCHLLYPTGLFLIDDWVSYEIENGTIVEIGVRRPTCLNCGKEWSLGLERG